MYAEMNGDDRKMFVQMGNELLTVGEEQGRAKVIAT